MRRLLTWAFLLPLVVASAVLPGPSTAYAGTTCQIVDPQTGLCTIGITTDPEPGTDPLGGVDGAADTGAGHACYWDPRKQGVNGPQAGPVNCTSESGYWSNHYNCYIRMLDPQPPAGDPTWRGHREGDGAVYVCYQPQTYIDVYLWSANPPPGAGNGPTPREVAQVAINRMGLRAVDIGIAPEPGADRLGLVGMPVWLWAKNPDSHTYGPITSSASAGGITVTATARVHQVTWEMGDGSKVVCHTAGTPYKASYGKKASPDCGHTYETSSAHNSGGRFTVTAGSDWVISWRGAGQAGTIRLDGLQRSVQIAVGEAQVLVR